MSAGPAAAPSGAGHPVPQGARLLAPVAVDGTRLRAALWTAEGARGTVLIFPGRTEYIEKYEDVAARLTARGLNAVAIDWRGQGASDRPGWQPLMGHVDDFAEFQRDVAALLALPEVAALPGPRILLAHSMGGAIGLRALLGGLDVAGAVFSAPMWGIHFAPAILRPVSRVLAELGTALGLGRRFAPGGGPVTYVAEQEFDGNRLTSNPAEYARLQAFAEAHPEMTLGGPSFAWVRAAFREMAALHRAPRPTLPIRVFLGGAEEIVDPAAVRNLTARLPAAKLVPLTG
ncbi:MAG: alpha/beta hydrolase, partial [Pseudomonadota bacterium]